MFGLFNKKKVKRSKPKLGIRFKLDGEEYICLGANAGSVEMAIIHRAKIVYAKNVLTGRKAGINPRWVKAYENIKYYEDGTWEEY